MSPTQKRLFDHLSNLFLLTFVPQKKLIDMKYTKEDFEALINSGAYGDPATFKDISTKELRFSENDETFFTVMDWIKKESPMTFDFGIAEGCPHYQFKMTPYKQRLYHNKEILNYLYSYFESGILNTAFPSSYKGAQNAKENYVLHLLKRDRRNGKLTFDETGYKAVYHQVTIHYGHLPFTPEELNAILDSLA